MQRRLEKYLIFCLSYLLSRTSSHIKANRKMVLHQIGAESYSFTLKIIYTLYTFSHNTLCYIEMKGVDSRLSTPYLHLIYTFLAFIYTFWSVFAVFCGQNIHYLGWFFHCLSSFSSRKHCISAFPRRAAAYWLFM